MIRIGLTILLTLLNITWISFFVYVKSHPSDEKIQPTMTVQSHVFKFDSIEIKFANQTPVVLTKKYNNWFLQSPIQWEANRMVLDNLLQTLANLNPIFSFKIDKTVDLSNYGLSFPFCILKCNMPEGSYTIHLGKVNEKSNKIYALEIGRNEIFVLDTKLSKTLSLTLEQWGNPFIFSCDRLTNIHFETNHQKLYLAYEQQKWQMKAPVVAATDQQHAEAICQQLLNLEYLHFLDATELEQWLPSFSKGNDNYRLTLQNESKSYVLNVLPYDLKTHTFMGQRNNSGPLFLFKSTVIERLLNPNETLRERVLFDFDLQDISKIVYTQGDSRFTLQPITNHKWEVVKNQYDIFIAAQKASLISIKNFIRTLNDIYVQDFIDKPIDLSDFKTTNIVITSAGVEENATFYTKDDFVYLKLDNDHTLFQLTLVNEDLFNKTFESFQNKTLWKWHPDETLAKISLWEQGKPPVVINPKNIDTSVLSKLEVNQWITEDIKYPMFFNRTWFIRIETVDAKKVQRIYELKFNDRISGSLQSGQYLSEKFLFKQEWIDILFQLIYKPYWDKMSHYFPLKQ